MRGWISGAGIDERGAGEQAVHEAEIPSHHPLWPTH
jgi:hypothetical protein